MSDTQQSLDSELTNAAENTSLSALLSLLDRGANVNGRHCLDGCRRTPLMGAAIKGNLEFVSILLQRGADPELIDQGSKTAAQLALENNRPEAAARIASFVNETNRDRVAFVSPLGDRLREDIYDFTMKERVTLVRQSRYGTVESAVVTGFSAIEDQSETSALRKAFAEHVKRGGMTEEAAVFAGARLVKPKPGLQRG